MHLMGERKERVAAAFADLLYDKDTSPHTKKPLQLTALLLPCDKTSLVKICCTGVLPQHHIHAKAQTPLYSDGVQLWGLTSALSANLHPRSPGTPPAATSPPCDRQQKPPALHTSQNQPLLRVTQVMWDINVVPTDIISILPAKPQTYHYKVIFFSLVVFFPSPPALRQCLSLFKRFLQSQWQEEVAISTGQDPVLPCWSQQWLSAPPRQIRRKPVSAFECQGLGNTLGTATHRACRDQGSEAVDAHHKPCIYELQCFRNMLAKSSPFPAQSVVITVMFNKLFIICPAS